MTMNAIFEDQKIPKEIEKHKVQPKASRGGFFRPLVMIDLVIAVTCLSSFCAAPLALALPVAISWGVPVKKNEIFSLEIAKDPQFSQVVLTAEVSGKEFSWEAPEEGVFHWRLLRVKPRQVAGERSSFLAGSFAVIGGSSGTPAPQDPVRLTWDPATSADRYKIFVLDASGKKRSMMTTATSFLVPRAAASQMVEVAAHFSRMQAVQSASFCPSLALNPGNKAPSVSSPAAVLATPSLVIPSVQKSSSPPLEEVFKKSPEVLVEKSVSPMTEEKSVPPPLPGLAENGAPPTAKAPAAQPETMKNEVSAAEPAAAPVANNRPSPDVSPVNAPEPKVDTPQTAPESAAHFQGKRLHLVQAFALYVDEQLQAQKQEINLDTEKRQGGAGAGLWTNPGSGLIISGQVVYFEHKDEIDLNDVFPDEKLIVQTARYTADLGLGWDLLHGFGLTNQYLAASVMLASAQVPRLPLDFEGTPSTIPGLENETLSLLGGGLSYAYFFGTGSPAFGLVLESGFLRDSDQEAKMTFVRGGAEWYASSQVAIIFGAFSRQTEVTRCHDNAETCMREGEVKTITKEVGVTLGLGLVSF